MSNLIGTLVRGEPRQTRRQPAGRWLPALTGRRAAGPSADLLEETLVVDSRASLGPAQMVERKLVALMGDKALSISQLRMALLSSRSHGQ